MRSRRSPAARAGGRARKRKPTTRAKTIRLPSADEEDLRDLEDILELAELFDYLEAA